MKTYTYPFMYFLLYRFGFFLLSLLLLLNLLSALIYLSESIWWMFPALISALLVYLLNKYSLMLHRILPYKITADSEKIICSKFFLSSKQIIIYYRNISKLSGGIFEGKLRGVMKIHDGRNNTTVGFFHTIKNHNEFGTTILSRIPKQVYDDMLLNVSKQVKKNK